MRSGSRQDFRGPATKAETLDEFRYQTKSVVTVVKYNCQVHSLPDRVHRRQVMLPNMARKKPAYTLPSGTR